MGFDHTIRQQAIDLYDRFTHEGMDRRIFMSRMAILAGSTAAAEALVATIAASPAAAAIVPPDDKRLTTRIQTLVGDYQAYVAEPRTRSLKPTILVIHENRGLNDHIRDVTRRLALAGYRAVAPDFLAPSGGTPANENIHSAMAIARNGRRPYRPAKSPRSQAASPRCSSAISTANASRLVSE